MKAVLLNRISMLLAFGGIFVAGTLSLAHIMHADVPCGAGSNGCSEITYHRLAYLFDIPVAYYGLAGYLVLAFLSGYRSLNGMKGVRTWILAGVVGSGAGVLASAYLTYLALHDIRKVCLWCLASATIMVFLFVAHLLMLGAAEPEGDTADLDFRLMLALGLSAGVGIIVMSSFFTARKPLPPPIADDVLQTLRPELLTPPGRHIEGAPDAPVTIVEFGDLTCSYCRRVYPDVRKLVDESKGKIRLVFRHLPLFKMEDHKQALNAAVISEIVREKSDALFWQFIGAMYALDAAPETAGEIERIAQNLGVDPKEMEERLKPTDKPDAAWDRVTTDLNLAEKIIHPLRTPTFIVYAKGVERREQGSSIEELRDILSKGQIGARINSP